MLTIFMGKYNDYVTSRKSVGIFVLFSTLNMLYLMYEQTT